MPFLSPKTYKKLQVQRKILEKKTIADLFKQDTEREKKFCLQQDGILYDFSKNIIESKTLSIFKEFLQAIKLQEKLIELYEGKTINTTEKNHITHISKRTPHNLAKELSKIEQFVTNLKEKKILGSNGKPIDTIINLGIGGSHLGMQMVTKALEFFTVQKSLQIFFISHYSGTELWNLLQKCNAETCMFFICTKSFHTPETLENAKLAKNWLNEKLGECFSIQKHFVAISSNTLKAKDFGITEEKIFTIDKGIGGRFSISSNMGLSLACAIGVKNFENFLSGFQLADKNLLLPFDKNIPTIMACIGVWYRNFWELSNYAILPYCAELEYFPSYLQQLEMESNGKIFDNQNKKIKYQTSPVIFGQRCTDAQHSFFQLLHQGSIKIPCDFISFAKIPSKMKGTEISHQKLIANFFAEQQTLVFGRKSQNIKDYQILEGNKPVSCLLLDELNPKRLGQLIAIYEHKVAIQGILWDICSFDQWGVEYGKIVAKNIFSNLREKNSKKITTLQQQQDFFFKNQNISS